MFWIGMGAGVVIGVIFHASLRKVFDSAKAKAKAAANEHL